MRNKSSGGGALRTVGHILLIILVTVLLLAVFLLAVMGILIHGPSTRARELFVQTMDETSALKFVPHIYLSDAKVDAILHPTDSDGNPLPTAEPFVELPYESGTNGQAANPQNPATQDPTLPENPSSSAISPDGEWIEIQNVKGATFKGKLMIVRDPSKVIVGTLDAYGPAYHGLYLYEFLEKYNAIGGTNAGGFEDPNGFGNGGTPEGLVIRDGQLAWGSPGSWYIDVVGFDANYKLHVGDMSGQQALDLGLTSAVSFTPGPVLIQDGVMRTGLGGGLNPRTCIGQTADGTVLLLVLEGRKPDSLGATYDDIAQLMYNYGAVNAANLDGGSSSLMYYNGEQITRGSNLIGMRQMATAILVLN